MNNKIKVKIEIETLPNGYFNINNMGITPISKFDEMVIKNIRACNPELTLGLTGREVLIKFDFTSTLQFARLCSLGMFMGVRVG